MIFFILIVLLIVTSLAYVSYLWWLLYHWKNASDIDLIGSIEIEISIVIAFRNEQDNLENLLLSFSKLNYPTDKFEIIFVNDHSTDASVEIVENCINQLMLKNVRLLSLEDGLQGKKSAIRKGVLSASNQIVATTDADCIVSANWLNIISTAFQNRSNKFVSMPVVMQSDNSLLQYFQQLDFQLLNTIGGASMMAGYPLMCNAANMAFYKYDYQNFNVSKDGQMSESGDDVFLMYHVKSLYKRASACVFIKLEEALVITQPQFSLRDFLNQRIRWAKKSKYYRDKYTIMVGAFLVLFHFLILLFTVLMFFDFHLLPYVSFAVVARVLVEYQLYSNSQTLYGTKVPIFYFIISSLLYPIFSLVVMAASIAGSYKWKERSIKN